MDWGSSVPRKDFVGRTFGRLTVKAFSHINAYRNACWVCECSCGVVATVRGGELTSGDTQSCGCLRKELMAESHTIHGSAYTTEYRIWGNILQRCINPNNPHYADYGGRGITVCDDWLKFENFYRDMGDRPSKDHTVDRIDNDGPYCKENCRWATQKQQMNNTRSNRFVEFGGESLTVAQWSVRTGIGSTTLLYRLNAGWPVELVLTVPVNKRKARQNA